MVWLEDALIAVRDFMELGGPVLNLIAITIFFMWLLIVERLIFFRGNLRNLSREVLETWEARPERQSWNAHQIRDAMISRVSMAANQWLPVIKTLVALCPLLGLLGTVTGMIEVFEVMAFAGAGNVRSMAAGVSKATIMFRHLLPNVMHIVHAATVAIRVLPGRRTDCSVLPCS